MWAGGAGEWLTQDACEVTSFHCGEQGGLFFNLKLQRDHSGQGCRLRSRLTCPLTELRSAAAEEGRETHEHDRGTKGEDPRGGLWGL